MKVSSLIEQLQRFNPESEVVTLTDYGYNAEVRELVVAVEVVGEDVVLRREMDGMP